MADDRLEQALKSPWTLGVGGLLALLGIGQGGLLWALGTTFWANADMIFTATSVFSFTLAPQLGLSERTVSIFTAAALFFGAVFVIRLGVGVWRNFQRRLDE